MAMILVHCILFRVLNASVHLPSSDDYRHDATIEKGQEDLTIQLIMETTG